MTYYDCAKLFITTGKGVARVTFSLLFLALIVHAQINTCTIGGIVRDPSGAAIPGSEVIVRSEVTGVKRSSQTNADGYYTIPLLEPGIYDIAISKNGFATAKVTGIRVQVSQVAKEDVTLQVGNTQQIIQVTGKTPILNTETAGLGTVVGSNQMVDLPLNGREISQLFMLSPGVAPVDNSSTNGTEPGLGAGNIIPSVDGQKNRSNMFYVDGMYASDPFFNGFSVSPSVDAIQEFKLQAHEDQSDIGSVSGGVVNIALKTGTNSFHGDAYEFIRNDAFDARGFFPPTKGAYRQNQFGATFGGPIQRDKTFFFGYYEGYRSQQASAIFSDVPTPSQINGDFAGSAPIYNPYTTQPDPNTPGGFLRDQFPGNMIPQNLLSSAIKDYIPVFLPAPNYSGVGLNYINTQSLALSENQFGMRVDHQIGSKDEIYGHFIYSEAPYLEPETMPSDPFEIGYDARNTSVNWIHTFGPTLVLQVLGGYNWYVYNQGVPEPAGVGQGLLDQMGLQNSFPPYSGATPYVQIPGMNVSGFFGTEESWGPEGPGKVYQLTGSLTKEWGRQEIKLGASANAVSSFYTAVFPSLDFSNTTTAAPENPSNTGSAMASFMMGLPEGAGRYLGNAGVTLFMWTPSLYVQDRYRITRKLTMNLGLRYDYLSPATDIDDRLSSFDIYTGQWVMAKGDKDAPKVLPPGVSFLPTNTIIPGDSSFSPRLGFAYQPFSKTVVRTGFGEFHDDWASYLQFAQNPRGNWPTGAGQNPTDLNVDYVNATIQTAFGTLPPTIPVSPFPSGAYGSDPRYKVGTDFQWNFGIEQQLSNTMILSIGYVGSGGYHNPVRIKANLAEVPGPGPIVDRQPFPQMEPFTLDQSVGTATYNSLQVELKKNLSHGTFLTAGYTYSKGIDIGCTGFGENCEVQSAYDLEAQRSVSAVDLPNIFTLSYIAELPFGEGKTFLSGGGPASWLAGGWRVAGITLMRSGQPYTVTTGFDNANVGGGAQRPNLIGNPNLSTPSAQEWFNTAAFAVPPEYTFGNLGRNTLFSDGLVDFDFSVSRSFRITERQHLEFRADFFNVFNTTNFGVPNGTLTSSSFGVVSSTQDPPREIQFGLKYVF